MSRKRATRAEEDKKLDSATEGEKEQPEHAPTESGGDVSGHGSEITHAGRVGVEAEPHPPTGSHDKVGSYYSPSALNIFPHQLPPLASYKGCRNNLERFSMLVEECKWTQRAKLLHLTSRLEKQAYAFYMSCPPQVKTSYESLTTELKKRFTPVRIQGVDTNLFHDRKQKPGETVDQYAQELRWLYQKAYPDNLHGSKDAEKMGKTLLASQFVSGLRTEIKKHVTGSDQPDNIEQLLVKARFEEAKQAELVVTETHSQTDIRLSLTRLHV